MMRKRRRALVVGRFQPLHYGHLHVFRYALSKADELVIAIGSSQFCCVPRNPLSVDERMEMLVRALRREGFPLADIMLSSVPDTGSPEEDWGLLVLDRVPRVDIAFSNDPETIRDLKRVGLEVENIPFLKRDLYAATKIRELMLKGDPSWKELVPPSVLEFLLEIDMEKRVREIEKG
ncbi:MAG: nicotinamide-nucleotide adenylyltransferase [Candidatus Korarchaeota archaeon]|nr:nicotinamide-nucleotide adenylyltransferase [Candidatus Korarchaeota archaeon]